MYMSCKYKNNAGLIIPHDSFKPISERFDVASKAVFFKYIYSTLSLEFFCIVPPPHCPTDKTDMVAHSLS